jgi:hypothetical protein
MNAPKGNPDMKIHRMDHVGVIVNHLPAAKAFFLILALKYREKGKNWKESGWRGLF